MDSFYNLSLVERLKKKCHLLVGRHLSPVVEQTLDNDFLKGQHVEVSPLHLLL